MSDKTTWLQRVVNGVRSFAYPQSGARPKIGLALGGGFARGLAHIGVLRAFEKAGLPIDCIAGTSVGALVAAAYAGGSSLDDMEQRGCETHFRDFGRWTLSRMGMASNQRLEEFLRHFTPVRHFREMKIPLSIVAIDIVSGNSVHFTEGEVGIALRASCAYPGLFLPVENNGHVLVDGFLTESVPAEAALQMGAQVVIGVHLEPGLLDTPPRNTIEVISRSFSILQAASKQAWRRDVDVLIEPDVHHIRWDEFAKTPQLVVAGEAAALSSLPKIRAALSAWPARLNRRRRDILRQRA